MAEITVDPESEPNVGNRVLVNRHGRGTVLTSLRHSNQAFVTLDDPKEPDDWFDFNDMLVIVKEDK